MNQITFPEVTNIISKKPFPSVPVNISHEKPENKGGLAKYISKYELSDVELAQVLKTGTIYVQQFGHGYQNTLIQVESPFLVCKVIYLPVGEFYDLTIPLDDKNVIFIKQVALENLIDTVLNTVPNLTAEQIWFFRQPSLEVGEDGILKFIKK